MAHEYHDGQRALQERFDTTRLAEKLAEVASDEFRPELARFVEGRDMFFIASTDPNGAPDCSYKGGDPGFVRVVDEHTLTFPAYDGNGMFRTLGNIEANPQVGLLFVDFESSTRLRVNGDATIEYEGPLVAGYPEAIAVVKVRARTIFANCGRYVHEYRKVTASPFVPREGAETPVPDWKRIAWFDGALPAGDPAHDPSRPTAPATPQFD